MSDTYFQIIRVVLIRWFYVTQNVIIVICVMVKVLPQVSPYDRNKQTNKRDKET